MEPPSIRPAPVQGTAAMPVIAITLLGVFLAGALSLNLPAPARRSERARVLALGLLRDGRAPPASAWRGRASRRQA